MIIAYHCPDTRSSHPYIPIVHAGADNTSVPVPTSDPPDFDHASGSPLLPATTASRPSSPDPSRQSSGALSRESHRPAPAPDPGVLVVPRPDGPVGTASPLDLANSPPCVRPGQTPARSLGSGNHTPEV